MDEIWPKRIFPAENGESEHYNWILHIQISLSTKFQLKLTILIFRPNLPKKGICGRKQKKKWISPLNCAYFNQSYFNLNRRFWFFFDQICPKRIFPVENRKSEHHHWIQHICINLGKVSAETFFGPSLHKKSIFDRKQKKWTSTLNCAYAYRISFSTKFQLKLIILIFWTKFTKMDIFRRNKKKWAPPLNSAYSNKPSNQISEHAEADRHNSILMSLLLLVAEMTSYTC